MDYQELLSQAPELAIQYGTKILMAFLIFFIGKWVAGGISRIFEKGMQARKVDPTVSQFIRNILYYLMMTVIFIAAMGQLGVQTASFVAVIGAAGLAVGLALQGSLSNFASGVLMILFRPIKVGDFVEAAGTSGAVKEISIFATTLLTPDNKTVIVSNSSVMDNNIINYSTQSQRRIDLVIGVSYDAKIEQVKTVLLDTVMADPRILKDQDVTIGLLELADSSVNFAVRPWVNTSDYWPTYFALMENIKNALDQAGIGIPYPQVDVHMVSGQQ